MDEPKQTLYVWDLPVRVTHWVTVISIVILTIAGFYIADPFITTQGPAIGQYLTGTVRLIHYITAFIFTTSVLFRIYWAFAGNKFARWSQFLPATRRRWRDLVRNHDGWIKVGFGWVIVLFGVQPVRLVHYLIMFLIIAFTIHHVDSAILIDIEERSSLISSMITGRKSLTARRIAEAQEADIPALQVPQSPGGALGQQPGSRQTESGLTT